MKNKRVYRITVRAAAVPKSNQWMWLALGGLLLLALFSLGLTGCSSQSAALAEPPAVDALPDEISVQQAYELYEDGAFVLDVRTQEEWDDFHAPNTVLIPLDQLPNRVDELPKDEAILVVCRSGNRSQAGRDILRQAGFENVASVNGGLTDWRASGYPIEP